MCERVDRRAQLSADAALRRRSARLKSRSRFLPPRIFPAGAQFAVVEGDPSKAREMFTIRLRFPNGYVLPPHFHPADEYVTVLQGTFLAGMGQDSRRTPSFRTKSTTSSRCRRTWRTSRARVRGGDPFSSRVAARPPARCRFSNSTFVLASRDRRRERKAATPVDPVSERRL